MTGCASAAIHPGNRIAQVMSRETDVFIRARLSFGVFHKEWRFLGGKSANKMELKNFGIFHLEKTRLFVKPMPIHLTINQENPVNPMNFLRAQLIVVRE
jgi:hypothetical protein